MNKKHLLRHIPILQVLTIAGLAALSHRPVFAQGVAPAPAFTSPDIKPTFADWTTAHPIALWKKIALTDPLLKPPFAAAAPDSLKGMAAGIRAVQLDVPNRVKAVQYLGTVDCVTYPQAQDMLIATMQEDPSEIVRYEAVMALRNMLTRGCCNMDSQCECEVCGNLKKIVRETELHARKGQRSLIKEAKGPAKKSARKAYRDREAEEQRYDCCLGCANEKAMKALAKVASEKDDQCCWFEPSERVRLIAADGMCLFKSYANGYSLPETGPATIPPMDESQPKDGEVEPSNDGEVAPNKNPDSAQHNSSAELTSRLAQILSISQSTLVDGDETPSLIPELNSRPQVMLELPVVPALSGRCIVALKSRQILPVKPQYSTVFEERTYFFSSEEAKSAFDQNPGKFAPAYGGLDPVSWLDGHTLEDGQFIREFQDQLFIFVSKENWETFKRMPARYVLKKNDTSAQPASSNTASGNTASENK